MRLGIAAVVTLVFSAVAFAAPAPQTYRDAKAVWIQTRNTAEYQRYAAEFSQFNNHFHLDEKDGCYALSSGPVDLMLVIVHPQNSEFAVVDRVYSNSGNAKARCFEKSYGGIQTKVPPFLPFVLQMKMG